MQLLAIKHSGAEADIVVPIRRGIVQVQRKAGTGIGRIVPIAAAKRSPPPHDAVRPQKRSVLHRAHPATNHFADFAERSGPYFILFKWQKF